MVKNKSLVIAGSVLTGVGSSLAVGSGLAYYFKYKQGNVTDSDWFKSLLANNVNIFAAAANPAAINALNAGTAAFNTAFNTATATSTAATAATAIFVAAGAAAATAANTAAGAAAAALALANTTYKELSLIDTINVYNSFIIYASTFLENLDATNPALADLISTLKALETASTRERDTIYALVSLFGAVGPAIVIAGVPTLVTGLVRSNKDKKRK